MKKGLILFVLVIDLILFGISSLMVASNKEKYTSSNIIAKVDYNDLSFYKNNHYKDLFFKYVQNTNIKIINNKQDFLNIIYTMLNNSYDYYDFKCSDAYLNCGEDISNTLNNRSIMNVINNLVSVYNSTNLNMEVSYLSDGNIRLYANKKYSNEEINYLDNRINYILKMLITDNMTNHEKIKKVHDYLANNIRYNYGTKSDSAYGALVYGSAICSGYADAFSLFMDKLNIPNYKVVSNTHVWNVVYINNMWMHIDLTYDDQSNDYNINTFNYNYYLINTYNLIKKNSKEHELNKDVYKELFI